MYIIHVLICMNLKGRFIDALKILKFWFAGNFTVWPIAMLHQYMQINVRRWPLTISLYIICLIFWQTSTRIKFALLLQDGGGGERLFGWGKMFYLWAFREGQWNLLIQHRHHFYKHIPSLPPSDAEPLMSDLSLILFFLRA